MHYGNQCPEAADNLNAFLQEHFPNGPTLESPDAIKHHVVARISEWNDEWQPKSLLDLIEGFLKRMPLHRLAHFLDMILPQLSPMHTRWDDPRKTLLCCHLQELAHLPGFVKPATSNDDLFGAKHITTMGCGDIKSGTACGLILQGHETYQPSKFPFNPCRK